MTSPSAETNDPDPPELNRTDDFWTWSSQPGGGVKSYRSFRCFSGGLLNSHMPSSAGAMGFMTRSAAATPPGKRYRVIGRCPWVAERTSGVALARTSADSNGRPFLSYEPG